MKIEVDAVHDDEGSWVKLIAEDGRMRNTLMVKARSAVAARRMALDIGKTIQENGELK